MPQFRTITTFLFILLVATSIFSQNRTIKVLGVSVSGNKTTDANMIRMQSGMMVGTELSAEGVQDAIRKLWRLNLFSDIQLLVDRQVADGYYITIQVAEHPRLEKVELQGNKKLKKDDIDETLNYYSGQIISPTSLSRSKSKLMEKYKEKGHLLAEIDIEQSPGTVDSSRVIVRFVFNEGKKVQVERIRLFGNKAFSDGKIRKQFEEIKEDKWWRSADFDREKYDADVLKIVDFYRNEGYRDAEIVNDSLYYNDDRDDMFIDIWLSEGPQYYFGDITFSGNKVFTNEELAANLRFEKNDVYSKKDLDEASFQHIGGLYYDLGYIFASATPREVVDAEKPQQLNVEFLMQEGKQAKIDEIFVSGNTKTKEKVIRRELRTLPGQTFNKSLLERSQRDVWMLNYFANVEPEVLPIDDEKINLGFKVEEKSTDTANMSAGWSERDKLIGSVFSLI